MRRCLGLFMLLLGCVPDADGDGFGEGDDCDDNTAATNPDADEVCDGVDNDCDGDVDEGVLQTFYRDADGDGYGQTTQATTDCDVPSGYADVGDDCDDGDAGFNPSADEICDALDNDCDGVVDNDVQQTFYRDADEDGYGDETETASACSAPSGYVTQAGDCDDADPLRSPETAWHTDADGDGYGDPETETRSCTQPPGLIADNRDCDDENGDAFPGAEEQCGDDRITNCDLTPSDVLSLCWSGETDTPDVTVTVTSTAGSRLAAAGDMNGDGIDDVWIGAPWDGGAGTLSGAAYLMFGSTSLGSALALSDMVSLRGVDAFDQAGVAIDGEHDWNGDGQDDVLISAFGAGDAQEGLIYAVFGPITGDMTLSDADAILQGPGADTDVGVTLGRVGDRWAIGATGDASDDGVVYLVDALPTEPTPLFSAAVSVIRGRDRIQLGAGMADGADYDGDGQDDLLLAGREGTLAVFSGPLDGLLALDDADHILEGAERTGTGMASPGDLNDDGYADVVIGDPGWSTDQGAVYVFTGPIRGRTLAAAALQIQGASGDALGGSISVFDDVDQDGVHEIVAGTGAVLLADRSMTTIDSGQSVVLFRSASAFATLDGVQTTSALAADRVFRADREQFGRVAAGAGDLNQDGFPDVIGASSVDGEPVLVFFGAGL
ncbi:MAG: MopE-related protein [Myxococcota bacterium]